MVAESGGHMTFNFLAILLYVNVVLIGLLYIAIKNYRHLFQFHDRVTVVTLISGFIAMICGVIFIYQFPFHYVNVTIAATLVGIIIGIIFGSIFRDETILTGMTHGMMMGLMAPMIGAATKNSYVFLIFLQVSFVLALLMTFHFMKKRSHLS